MNFIEIFFGFFDSLTSLMIGLALFFGIPFLINYFKKKIELKIVT